MKISYDGMGLWAATFAVDTALAEGSLTEGKCVKMSASETITACADGNDFCGVMLTLAHDKAACAVQLGGVVTAVYTGTAPTAGYCNLAADAAGGVKTLAAGRSHLVLSVDESAKTVSFVL